MNTDTQKSCLISAILLEMVENGVSHHIDLEAGKEQQDIMLTLLDKVSYSENYYRVWFCEGPGRRLIARAALGRQRELEEMPFVQLLLHIDATLLTVEQQYNQHRESQRTAL